MKFRWSQADPNPLMAAELARQCHISPLFAQCLINRGMSEPGSIAGFLEPRLKTLSDPFLLPGMAAAVDLLYRARETGEFITIFGDYDVDGVTSLALLLDVLQALGWRTQAYIPDRFDEGYGLSPEAVENCLKQFPARLLLAVDCGSTSVEVISRLKTRGVEVIVLDHHQVSDPPPPACALINPRVLAVPANRVPTGDAHPQPVQNSIDLCSVGLAFKLAHALLKRGRETGLAGSNDYDLKQCLDLVALGTIADLVPLTGENRVLVSAGLERLRKTTRPGLQALKEVARCPECLTTVEVGFQLAPRLNAAGRMETAQDALKLLTAADAGTVLGLAEKLDGHNRERQRQERAIAGQALEVVQARFNPDQDYVIVEGQEVWHVGVVGIVASRILHNFHRPTIILGGDGACYRGSGRSIPGFDLAAALRQCGDLLLRHGGHAMAAGLSLDPQNLDQFRARLNEIARKTLRPEDLQPAIRIDCEVGLDELTVSSIERLELLKPCGQGNPPLHFSTCRLTQAKPLQRMGSEKQHVKLWVTDGTLTHEAVWWGGGSEPLPVGRFDLAFAPQINDYNGRKTVQLRVLDWRPCKS